MEQAGRVRDAAEYAFEKRDYFTAARLLVRADDAAAVTRLVVLSLSEQTFDECLIKMFADDVAQRPKDAVWASILYLLSLPSESDLKVCRALEVAQQYAQRTAEGQSVPSLVEIALWRIARDFTTQHCTLRSLAAIDALLALRTRMGDDLFEYLALPLCVLRIASDN